MPKQLVVCCDGTWDVPDQLDGGIAAPTNVAKLALGIATDEASGQLLYYEPGVGTTPDERIVGGAFGYGLSNNIRNCYRFLAQSYDPGDRLFLFGFSRGAYTARSLGGLIRNCGILRSEHVDQVDDAFAFYRDRTSHTHPSSLASQIFRRMYSYPDDDIHFIGVWDTVGALGIPTELPLWKEISDRRATNMRRFAADLRSTGELRDDLTDDDVADIVWSMNGTEYWVLLVGERGWSRERFAAYLIDAWSRLLLT